MRVRVNIDFQLNTITRVLPVSGSSQANVSNLSQLENSSLGFKGFHLAPEAGKNPSILNGAYGVYPDSGYPGYISKSLSGADGSTDMYIDMSISGVVPDTLYLTFDRVCGEYAKSITVTNKDTSASYTIENDEVSVFLDMAPLGDVENLRVTINEWSQPNKNIKITQLSANYVTDYTETEIISVETSENLMDSNLQIEPGICEQYAEVSIYDRSGVLHNFAQKGVLVQDQVVSVSIIDDDNNEQIVGIFYSSSWDVDSNSSTVKLTSKDTSAQLEKIQVDSVAVADRNVHQLLTLAFAFFPGATWVYLSSDDEEWCKNIVTPNSWLAKDNLYNTLKKVCLLGQLRIYWNGTAFVVARCF